MADLFTEQKELEQIVAKVDCGKEHGNAILFSRKYAVTAKHCVKPAYENGEEIWLTIVPNLGSKPIKAAIDPEFNADADEWVMLELEQETMQLGKSTFASVELLKGTVVDTYGYDRNYRTEACWTKLISIGSANTNKELIQDMIFQLPGSREKDFSGLSGSPIFIGNYIIGIISCQKNVKGEAIDLRGISVKSSMKYMERKGIAVKKISSEELLQLAKPFAVRTFQPVMDPIAVADSFDCQKILSGKYHDELEAICELHSKGDIESAWMRLRKGIEEIEQNHVIAAEVKAGYFMKMAVWYLEDKGDCRKAQKKYEAAKRCCQNIDGSIFLALQQAYEGNKDRAIELLEPVNSVQKLNVYMQICANNWMADKGLEKYDVLAGTIQENDVTYYLLSILALLNRDYDNAVLYIDMALDKSTQIPMYYLMKAVILYWKAAPDDMHLSEELYPPMFCGGIIHLETEAVKCIKKASELCREAYIFAESVKNTEMQIVVLTIWINILSIETDLKNDILYPLQKLQKIDTLNITLLLYSIQKNLDLDDSISIDSIKERLQKEKNKIGYVIVLLELYLKKNDWKKAKQCLHEYKSIFRRKDYVVYWYDYVARLETDPVKLEEYEKEMELEPLLEPIHKKRIRCLFMEKKPDRLYLLENTLLEIFSDTQQRLDLMNILSFYFSNMRWCEVEKYSMILSEKFYDSYGYLYHIRALIQMEKYEQALGEIEELQGREMPHTYKELLHNRMIVMDRLGRYEDAIDSGEELIKEDAAGKILVELSAIYIRNGEPERALAVLLRADQEDQLTVEICQQISMIYLTNKQDKAWKYAQKAVRISKDDPNIIVWAINIANRSGHSEKAAEYYHKLFMEYPDTQLIQVKTLEETVELLKQSRTHAQEMAKQYENGQLPAHLYVDSFKGNLTYGEFFYRQWNEQNMAPLEFGAHYYQDRYLKLDGKIGLDYSSCILLHETGMLDLLLEYVSEIYVPGELLGVIEEELRKIPVVQPELAEQKISLLESCKKLGMQPVKTEVPEMEQDYNIEKWYGTICKCTAFHNGALWITNEKRQGIHANNVIEALYQDKLITEYLYQKYSDGYTEIDEASIVLLRKRGSYRLLVDEDVLAEWKEYDLLEAISKNYSILYLESMSENIMQKQQEICLKTKICGQLKSLEEHLKRIRDAGKLKFYPMRGQREGMPYSNMLTSLLEAVGRDAMSICIDDRMMTSYSNIGGAAYIYNTFDVLRILYINQKFSLEKYCSVLQKLNDANVQYTLPPEEFLMYAIKLSDIEGERLAESRMLAGIRKNVLRTLSKQSYISTDLSDHVWLPEREYYLFYLQRETGNIIQNIWQSAETLQKKYAASNWILWHYSLFAFRYDNSISMDNQKHIISVFLADFLLKGILISLERDVEEYFRWMYEWMDVYFDTNIDLREKTLAETRKLLSDLLQDKKYLKERRFVCWKIATAIHLMPEDCRSVILEDKILLHTYNRIYSRFSILLTNSNEIPEEQFVRWEWEVLHNQENEPIYKKFQRIAYELRWVYAIPALQIIRISWKEDGIGKERRFYMDRGKRLLHREKNVRKEEFKYLEPYLLNYDYSRQYLDLMKKNGYKEAAEGILKLLDLSADYECERIDYGLRNFWLADCRLIKFLLPEKNYFRQFYDWKRDKTQLKNANDKLLWAVPVCLQKKTAGRNLENYNPVSKLRQLAQGMAEQPEHAESMAIEMFSYLDGEFQIYGRLYMVLLKAAWKMFETDYRYKSDNTENKIIWSYIWADEAAYCVAKWEREENIDLMEFLSRLETETEINIDQSGFADRQIEDVLSPVHMNLFKICVTGTLAVCNCYKQQIGTGLSCILNYVRDHLNAWIDSWISLRELELSHQNDRNAFQSIFSDNFFTLIGLLSAMVDEKVSVKYICIEKRIELRLIAILDHGCLTDNDLSYLFLLTREKRTEEEICQIENIIEKYTLKEEFAADQLRYRALAGIVCELSEKFQERFIEAEYKRICKQMVLNEKEWSTYYNIAVELYQRDKTDYFVEFLEQCVKAWTGSISLEFAEILGMIQLYLPYGYSESLIDLRIEYELKDTNEKLLGESE